MAVAVVSVVDDVDAPNGLLDAAPNPVLPNPLLPNGDGLPVVAVVVAVPCAATAAPNGLEDDAPAPAPKGLEVVVEDVPNPEAPNAPADTGLAPNADAPNGFDVLPVLSVVALAGCNDANGDDARDAEPNAPPGAAPKPDEPNAPPVNPVAVDAPNGFAFAVELLPNGFDVDGDVVEMPPNGLDAPPNGFDIMLDDDACCPDRLTGSTKAFIFELGFCVANCKYRTPLSKRLLTNSTIFRISAARALCSCSYCGIEFVALAK